MIAMTIAATARTPVKGDDPPAETDDTELTLYEELEARSIAEQFAARFEGSDDLLSIVDDLYVKDFNERLRNDVADRFIVPIASDLAERVEGDELGRCHILTLKLNYLYTLLRYAWWHSASRLNTRPGDSETEPSPDEVLPPSVIAMLMNDPAFAKMLLEDSKNHPEANAESENQPGSEDSEEKDQTIKDMERLRNHVAILGQAVSMMREHLQTLPVPQTWQSAMDSVREPGKESAGDTMRPRALILAGNSMGFPKGTRLILVNVMLFRMDLVRVDGQLKILDVYPEDD
jgi:hypothetical protein